MKQTLISLLLTVLLSMTGIEAFAHDIEVANSDGVTIYYKWSNNKTELAVSCRGSSYKDYNEYQGNVVIPASVTYNGTTYPVTSINPEAFQACVDLTSVTIPNTVTSIWYSAFMDCSGLTSVTIPNSVSSIGKEAFNGTAWYNNQPDGLVYAGKVLYKYKGIIPNNTSIIVEEGTLGIADGAFSGCRGLTSVTIPKSVTSIGSSAFYGCNGLTSVHISSLEAWCKISFTYYTDNPLFYAHHLYLNGEEIKELVIPNSVTSIICSFSGCTSLTSAIIPNSVTSIEAAFPGCTNLTSVVIPNSVTSMDFAFYGCTSLTSVDIPDSVAIIYSSTFADCYALTSVNIGSGVKEIMDWAFSNCKCLSSVTIPRNVSSIHGSVFHNCSSLLKVTSLSEAPNNIAASAFSNETYRQGTLYVPEGTKDLYSRFDGWRNFLNIVEMADEGSVVYLSLKDAAAGQMKLQVKKGENYTFAIEAEAGWKVSSIIYNGVDVTKQLDEQGRFTTPVITADAILNVVYEQLNTQMANANVEDVKMRVVNGGFNITNASDGTLCQVFSVDGKLLKSVILYSGSTFIPLPEGQVYIVKIGDKTLKATL